MIKQFHSDFKSVNVVYSILFQLQSISHRTELDCATQNSLNSIITTQLLVNSETQALICHLYSQLHTFIFI